MGNLPLMYKPFAKQFEELILSEGWASISDFVNNWISKGGTFRSLHQHLLLKNMDVTYITVWSKLRKSLTIPYGHEDYFWYKWDSVARTKGFSSFLELYKVYIKKYTTVEMSRELGANLRTMETILNRMDKNRKKGPHRDELGYSKTNNKEKWNKILKEHEFNSLQECWNKFKSIRGMAIALEVSEAAIWYRMKASGIKFRKFYLKKKKETNKVSV